MSKYKVGDKVVMEITDKISVMGEPWYVLSEATSISETYLDKAAEPLGTYTEPLEAKIRRQAAEWEKAKEEIKVGDVVSHEEKYGVVISEGTICFRGFTDDGTPFEWYKERCTKTGRHIDIDGFLRQIGGE